MNSVSPGHFAKAKPGGPLLYVYAIDQAIVYYLTITQIDGALRGVQSISAVGETETWLPVDRPSDMRVWVAISEALGSEWDQIMI